MPSTRVELIFVDSGVMSSRPSGSRAHELERGVEVDLVVKPRVLGGDAVEHHRHAVVDEGHVGVGRRVTIAQEAIWNSPVFAES
jgi:hypothetical protein